MPRVVRGVVLAARDKHRDDLSGLTRRELPGRAGDCRKSCRCAPTDDQEEHHCGGDRWLCSAGSRQMARLVSLPVMEGKAALFKRFAGVHAWPVRLDTQDSDKIVEIVKAIAPVYGGINWKTYERRAASRSRSDCAPSWTSRCSTMISTVRRSWC